MLGLRVVSTSWSQQTTKKTWPYWGSRHNQYHPLPPRSPVDRGSDLRSRSRPQRYSKKLAFATPRPGYLKLVSTPVPRSLANSALDDLQGGSLNVGGVTVVAGLGPPDNTHTAEGCFHGKGLAME